MRRTSRTRKSSTKVLKRNDWPWDWIFWKSWVILYPQDRGLRRFKPCLAGAPTISYVDWEGSCQQWSPATSCMSDIQDKKKWINLMKIIFLIEWLNEFWIIRWMIHIIIFFLMIYGNLIVIKNDWYSEYLKTIKAYICDETYICVEPYIFGETV